MWLETERHRMNPLTRASAPWEPKPRSSIRRRRRWLFFLCWWMALSSSALIQAQNRVGEVDRIGKPPDGASEYRRGEPVSTVKIFRPGGSGEHGFAGFPLEVGDEISIERGLPEVYQVVIAYDDPTVKLLKLAPGDYVRLLDHDSIRADGGFLGWIVGKIRATTQYVQAIAPGTQYGIEVVGDRSRVFVWEGEVQVTNLGSNPQTVIVGEKQLTEAVGSNRPSAPRVPRFDEVRDLVLFGLEIDPVIRGTVTDETLRRRLHEDTIRAEFESRAQRSAVAPHINLGHVYLFLGKYNEALRAFELAEQVSPRPSAIYNGRGIALTMLGRFDAAAEAFGQAISRDDESMFHNNLANLYLRRGALDEALVEYERAIERDSKNAAPINGQGVVHFEQRDFPAAESAFRSSLKRANRAIPHSNLGNVFLLRGDVVSASREYDEAVTLDPQHAAAWNNRGVAHLKQREFRAARRAFQRAIRVHPREAAGHIGLGLAQVGLQEWEKAVDSFASALKHDDTNRTAYRNLAYLYLTEKSVRDVVERQLESLVAVASPEAGERFRRFIAFLSRLRSTPVKEFDAVFQQFEIGSQP